MRGLLGGSFNLMTVVRVFSRAIDLAASTRLSLCRSAYAVSSKAILGHSLESKQ